jgi:hypothetical protein
MVKRFVVFIRPSMLVRRLLHVQLRSTSGFVRAGDLERLFQGGGVLSEKDPPFPPRLSQAHQDEYIQKQVVGQSHGLDSPGFHRNIRCNCRQALSRVNSKQGPLRIVVSAFGGSVSVVSVLMVTEPLA